MQKKPQSWSQWAWHKQIQTEGCSVLHWWILMVGRTLQDWLKNNPLHPHPQYWTNMSPNSSTVVQWSVYYSFGTTKELYGTDESAIPGFGYMEIQEILAGVINSAVVLTHLNDTEIQNVVFLMQIKAGLFFVCKDWTLFFRKCNVMVRKNRYINPTKRTVRWVNNILKRCTWLSVSRQDQGKDGYELRIWESIW